MYELRRCSQETPFSWSAIDSSTTFHVNRITGQAPQATDGKSRNKLGQALYDETRMIASITVRYGRDTDLCIAAVIAMFLAESLE